MKQQELSKLTEKELNEKLRELSTQLIKERAQAVRGTQSKNPMLIKNTRKTIARIMQLLNVKKRGGYYKA
ncbi:50S ribosomal protein L29 [Candidatus Woesearchaeota archaeon]|nr:50S ribosomal protein L29 [Candidatus Woesearchaeota archaeon]